MPNGHLPYFPFYVSDFCSDGLVEAMTTEEVGAYILLLCKAWQESPVGSIPNDDRILARWSRLSEGGWGGVKKSVLLCFKQGKDGRFYQKRMVSEHKLLIDKKKERAASGKIGAEKRWHSYSTAIKQPLANDSNQSQSQSQSTPLPLGTSPKRIVFKAPTRGEVDLACTKAGLPPIEAEKFWNHYMSNGWKVGKNRMQSLPHAVGGWAARWREAANIQRGSNGKPRVELTDAQVIAVARGEMKDPNYE